MRINGTDATNDDVVRKGYDGFGSDIPASHPSVLGEVRLARPLPVDINVDLTNPDGELALTDITSSGGGASSGMSYQNAGPATNVSKMLPKSGDWVQFNIAGVSVSATIGDAVVSVTAHLPLTNSGITVAHAKDKGMTVFWFTNAKMVVTAPGQYLWQTVIHDGKLAQILAPADNKPAVETVASASLAPFGIDARIPQIAGLRLGILQNITSGKSAFRYRTAITWDADVATGTDAQIPESYQRSTSIDLSLDVDRTATSPPFYNAISTFAAQNVSSVRNFDAPVAGNDELTLTSPDYKAVAPYDLEHSLGTFSLKLDGGSIDGSVRDWAAVGEVNGAAIQVIAPLAESGWSMHIDSALANAAATPDRDAATGGHPPVNAPLLSGDTANNKMAAAPKVESGLGPLGPFRIVTK